MPMHIPAGAKIISDSRITAIRVISTLYDRLVNADGGLKDKVKSTLQDKKASFAESDLVLAALRAGSAKSTIDPHQLYKLVEAKKLKLVQFLECVTIRKEPLKQYLAGEAIEKMTSTHGSAEPSLVTEFKEGVELDIEALAEQLAAAVAKAVPIKTK